MLKPTSEKHSSGCYKKHFPRDHKLYRIFNRNTLKFSYSYMSSMSRVIKEHNYKVLSTTKCVDRLCNCRNKGNCPLGGKCLQICIASKAHVIMNKDSHVYYGASDGEFKSPYNNHTNSFCHRHDEQDRTFKTHLETTREKNQLHGKMECQSLCLNIQMWVKKV